MCLHVYMVMVCFTVALTSSPTESIYRTDLSGKISLRTFSAFQRVMDEFEFCFEFHDSCFGRRKTGIT